MPPPLLSSSQTSSSSASTSSQRRRHAPSCVTALLVAAVVTGSIVVVIGRLLPTATASNATTNNSISYDDIDHVVAAQWRRFKQRFGRQYSTPAEDAARRAVFADNWHYIRRHNERQRRGEVKFRLGINQFADMSHAEFLRRYILPNSPEAPIALNQPIAVRVPPLWLRTAHRRKTRVRLHQQRTPIRRLPASRDWRRFGRVTAVRDQGRCGSCWAFAAVSALESHLAIQRRRPAVALSVQQLLDCTRVDGNQGCSGGDDLLAYRYMQQQRVLSERAYPYRAAEGPCRSPHGRNSTGQHNAFDGNGAVVAGQVRDFVLLRSGNERLLRNAVGLLGPVSVSVDASLRTFQLYSSGVFEPAAAERCGRTIDAVNHVMVVVGYGREPVGDGGIGGGKYWLVKNSMGDRWGEAGYWRLRRNAGNLCGLATMALMPVVVGDERLECMADDWRQCV